LGFNYFMKTILEILILSADYLKRKGIAHHRRHAEELIADALKITRMGLYLEFDRPLTSVEIDTCRSWLLRRGKGEPLQYIRGEVDFFNCSVKVTPDVLIPRQETEILVDKIVKELETISLNDTVMWDLCCGSGCIGIAIKKRFPQITVILSDISPAALGVAKENAQKNGVEVGFLQGDLLIPFGTKRAHFLVCNPPYVAEHEFDGLDIEVRVYEPRLALLAGSSGLEFYQRLALILHHYLLPSGKVWFEIGDGQGEAVRQLFSKQPWKTCHLEKDWSGRERFFSLEIE
jgi:release factor glutamine methyltransferase